jgi:hypothetical protein
MDAFTGTTTIGTTTGNGTILRRWCRLDGCPLTALATGPDLTKIALPQSDAIMSRTISMLIKLRWTPEQVRDRLARMKSALA